MTIDVSDDANEPPAITGTVPDSIMEETETLLVVWTSLRMTPIPTTPTRILPGRWVVLTRVTSPSLGGALTFKASPNYEMPADADGDNVYEVTVAASDADSNRGEKSVKVKVANVDEPGTVTLSAVQPRVGVPLTASLTDLDGGVSGLKWQWSNGGDIDGATSDTYTPTSEDVTSTLTATATYTDAQGPDKTAPGALAANDVEADTRNKAPAFADQDDDTEGTQNTEAERTIAENSAAGTPLNGGESVRCY